MFRGFAKKGGHLLVLQHANDVISHAGISERINSVLLISWPMFDEKMEVALPEDDDGPRIHEFMNASLPRGCLDHQQKLFSQEAKGSATLSAMQPVLPDGQDCCKRGCRRKFASHPDVFVRRTEFQKLDKTDQQQWLFNQMLLMGVASKVPDDSSCGPLASGCAPRGGDVESGCDPLGKSSAARSSGSPQKTKEQCGWQLAGREVCFRAWCFLLSVGTNRVRQVLRDLTEGAHRPKQDQRMYNQGRLPESYRKVDAFLEFAYQNMAEPLADASCSIEEADDVLLPDDVDEIGMEVLHEMTCESRDKPLRFMHPGSVTDLYDTYCQFERGDAASESTFRRVFKAWHCLKFRRLSQHAKCTICGKLQKLRKDAKTEQERTHYQKELEVHLQGMFADRAVDARLAKLSEESAHGTLTGQQGILSIAMDGMDQAKFKCPRMKSITKDLETLWRPVLHVTGCLAEGVGEYYYIAEGDCKKNSDANIQCLGLTLDHVAEIYKSRLLVVPHHLVILTDNTAREQKNQHTVAFLAWLVASGRFQTVTNNFFRVGHTHMKLDQRFSVVGSALASTQTLETPHDFAGRIKQQVRHPHILTHVEVTSGAWDWQRWFCSLGLAVSGLTPAPSNPEVCHCWKFVRRGDLRQYIKQDVMDLLVVPEEFMSEPSSADDCIFLAKHFVSSKELAQLPVLVLPTSRLSKLQGPPLSPLPRNPLSEDAVREYEKTATRIALTPWSFTKASRYLMDWVRRNSAKEPDHPSTVEFLLHGRNVNALDQDPDLLPPGWQNFAPRPPRTIEIKAPPRSPQVETAKPGGESATTNRKRNVLAKKQTKTKITSQTEKKADGCAIAGEDAHTTFLDGDPADGCAPAAADGSEAGRPMFKRPATHALAISERIAKHLITKWPLAGEAPGLGCGKCRNADNGCMECKLRRERWLSLQEKSVS